MNFLRKLFTRVEEAASNPKGDPLRIAEVESVLLELRPLFVADGGDVLVSEVEENGAVHLKLKGACSHCGVREMTVHEGIEPRLRERCTWVTQVYAA